MIHVEIPSLFFFFVRCEQVLQLWLLSQNVSFAVAGGAVIAILKYTELKTANYAAFISLLVLINISGAVAVLSTLAGTILVEREW